MHVKDRRMRVAIIVSSDSGYEGTREDISGAEISEILKSADYEITERILLPDEQQMLEEKLIQICEKETANLIVTTGGTGFSKRDCMPEATRAIIEREVPGIPEAMRAYSMQITKRAMLSRGIAGIRKNTLIINLPGSPKAVKECLEYVLPELAHGLEILLGIANDCARQ